MKFLALLLTFFALQTSKAAINCTEYLRHHGAFQIHRSEGAKSQCFLSADPFNPPASFIYRSYLVSDEGLLMVFNSYGTNDGEDGARVFYFFPRQIDPDMEGLKRGQIAVKTATPGIELILSTDQAKIAGMKGGKVKESSQVSPSNFGGVEFSQIKSLYLDAGFRMGQDPTADPKRSSKFIDIRNQSCVVRNDEIFNYTSDGDSSFKFSDSDLKNFLSSRCPNLFVNF